MSIPDYQSLMLPLLEHTSDGREHPVPSLVDALAADYKLTDSERRELLPSGRQVVFDNRVGWARTYMKKAGLLSSPKRGMVQITERGLQVLKDHPTRIDNKVLRRFPEFVEFQSAKAEDVRQVPEATIAEELDPQENIEAGYHRIQKQLSAELLARIKGCSPEFFERLVVELLLKMGYGGSRRDAGMAIGKSGDGGVDGVIKEDKLGLDAVYIQAKRWDDGTVGSKEIQAFVGALHGKKARKGVFITTSGFSKPARDYVRDIQDKVILIDGNELADLLIEHGVGVSTVASYEIKKIDTDYFADE
ncbi:MAG: restriction endonuclease [Acidobacteriia bacterium]|nr:restriction endonuclease [Terriglobia bacterium]